ncbi:MAG: metal-dependent hydrolase [Halobacteria archaeon]
MPSELFHAALAGLIATSLLKDEFSVKTLGVVVGVTVIPVLDTFVGLVVPGGHRAVLHNLFLPVSLGAMVALDWRYRRMLIDTPARLKVAVVSVFSLTFAGIGVDFFYNGVNLFYPLHDQFIEPTGHFYLSNMEGLVFFDFSGLGGTSEVHYPTAADPTRGEESGDVERRLPISWTGIQFVVTLTGFIVVGARLLMERSRGLE